jgi:hypothetical protein
VAWRDAAIDDLLNTEIEGEYNRPQMGGARAGAAGTMLAEQRQQPVGSTMADSKEPRQTYAANFIKGDWDKAVYLDSVHADNLVSVVLALGAEVWTMRRRMMVLEKVMGNDKVAAAIESYVPSKEEGLAWDTARDEFIERTFSALTRTTANLPTTPPTGVVPPFGSKG